MGRSRVILMNMRRVTYVFGLIFAVVALVEAQGARPLENVARPCEGETLVQASYSKFGMISGPNGDRNYLQVCADGRYAYQTDRGELKSGILDTQQMRKLTDALDAPETQSLSRVYDGGPTIDVSLKLEISIHRGTKTQFITLKNLPEVPKELLNLVRELDALRPLSQFSAIPTL